MFVRAVQRSVRGGSRHFHAASAVASDAPIQMKRTLSISELHAEALRINEDQLKEEQTEWRRKRNVPGLKCPEALKLKPTDSMDVKKWKYRQQERYEMESKCDYILDALDNDKITHELLGLSPDDEFADEVVASHSAGRRARLKKLTEWKPPLTGRQISLEKLEEMQERFLSQTDLKMSPFDTEEEKKIKAEKQLDHYISESKDKLDKLGDPNAEYDQFRKEFKVVDQEELELNLMEMQDELEKVELPEGVSNFSDFHKHMLKLQKEINENPQSAAQVVRAEPLQQLGLVRSHSLLDLDREMQKAQELEKQITDEFAQRFGNLPASLKGPMPTWEEWNAGDEPDLKEWQHLTKLDYSKFERAPTELETTVMDAYARKKQLFDAQINDTTMHDRIAVPSGPYDKGPFTRALHLFRVCAVRDYLHEIKEERRKQREFGYRDLEDLGLVMDDPEYPWKNEIFEEHKLALRNNPKWTQGQKEKYLKMLHKFLRSDVFSKEFVDSGLV